MKMLNFLLVAVLIAGMHARAQDWPREFASTQGKVVLYQPQPDAFNTNLLSGVVAFSIVPKGSEDPLFGALFFEARLNVDRDQRTYQLESMQIPNIKFSGEKEGVNLEQLKGAIITEVKTWNISGSLDELLTTIEETGSGADKNSEAFKNDPPRIIFTTKPTVLVNIDGEPVIQEIPKSGVKRLVNTPFVIFQAKDKQFYLYGGETWFRSATLTSGWKTTTSVPSEIKKLMEQNKEQTKSASQVKKTEQGTIPEIMVTTTPTELIQTNGTPNYVPVEGTNLLYAKNSEDNLFKDLNSQDYYILKSGRWFTSRTLEGNWQYKPADQLPADFARIPKGSDRDIVLSSVPGTTEARDAVLDARVPQTATIDRKTAGKELKVEYDGAPRFEPISGTQLQLAENANKTVMKSGSKYYVVDNGVWYESGNYNGPWAVSTTRPADVADIPPSSPAYNTRYVEIYDHTPDVVYVGYTPGYLGSYVYGPTVVYGTGYYYRPWYGSYYYPRPTTWGFNMNYNPWTGWSIGFGFSSGPFHFGFGTGGFSFGMSFGSGGWFGPPIYRPPVIIPNRPWYGYNRPNYGNNVINRPINGNGSGNNNIGGGNQINIGGDVNINIPGGNNIYTNKNNNNKGISSGIRDRDLSKVNVGRPNNNTRDRSNNRPNPSFANKVDQGKVKPQTPVSKDRVANPANNGSRDIKPANNVYADRDGNVFRKDGNEWQQHKGNGWDRPAANTNRMGSFENKAMNRDRGAQRTRDYRDMQRSRPQMNSRPAPAARPAPSRPANMSRPAPKSSASRAGRRF